MLNQRHIVSQKLYRMVGVCQSVDNRSFGIGGKLFDHGMIKRTDHHHIVHGRDDTGRVFNRFAASEMNVAVGEEKCMTTQLEHACFETVITSYSIHYTKLYDKSSEGVASAISYFLKDYIKRSPIAITGALLMRKVFKLLKKETDYAEFGGAPLIGIKGCVIVGHGKSNSKAIMNAIFQAIRYVDRNNFV